LLQAYDAFSSVSLEVLSGIEKDKTVEDRIDGPCEFPVHFTVMTTKTKQCPYCRNHRLQRIGVSGIKKCSGCGSFVDVRKKGWLKRLISA
jgi:uncharacterized protein (DUF983 family)